MEKIKIVVVEDQPKILKNQIKLLKGFSEIEILGSAMDGNTAIREILKLKPDVVLLDLGLPEKDGIEVTRAIKKSLVETEILIFTIFDEEKKVLEAIRAGASGYLLKGATVEKIVESIIEIHQGGSVIQPSLARSLLRFFHEESTGADQRQQPPVLPERQPRLTAREEEILKIIAKGLSNNEAAQVLGISKATIRTHLEHIYAKLEVTCRVEAVTEGIRHGIIDI